MHLTYIDDSRDEQWCAFSALAIPAAEWKPTFAQVRQFRHDLRRSDGIFVYKEFHATDFVGGPRAHLRSHRFERPAGSDIP